MERPAHSGTGCSAMGTGSNRSKACTGCGANPL